MGLVTLSPADQPLLDVLSESAPATIAEVISRMQAIDALLAPTDGIKWFNRLYLTVTQQVDLDPPGGAWQSPKWFTKLDTNFAGLYLGALGGYLTGQVVPTAWRVLFDARYKTDIDRIQFALAGMNAHINRDLSLALLATDAGLNMTPGKSSLEYSDYEAVNGLLGSLIPAVLTTLATDTLGVLAQDTGKIGRLLAFWDICKARELAWDFADQLRGLDGISRAASLESQDVMTGVLGRAILAAV